MCLQLQSDFLSTECFEVFKSFTIDVSSVVCEPNFCLKSLLMILSCYTSYDYETNNRCSKNSVKLKE